MFKSHGFVEIVECVWDRFLIGEESSLAEGFPADASDELVSRLCVFRAREE